MISRTVGERMKRAQLLWYAFATVIAVAGVSAMLTQDRFEDLLDDRLVPRTGQDYGSLPKFEHAFGLPFPGWVLGFGIIGLIVCLPFFFRAFLFPRVRSILWLRRFHREHPPEFPVSQVMRRLCRLGLPVVTLRDRSVAGGTPLAEPLTPVFLIGGLVVTVWLLWILEGQADRLNLEGPFALVIFGGLLALPVLIVPFFKLTQRALAVIRFSRHELKPQEIERLLHGVGKARAEDDVVVLAAADENWQAIVRAALEETDFVMVDLSDPSPNLHWEVQSIAASGAAERIIWMANTAAPAELRILNDGSYEALNCVFRGKPTIVTYPTAGSRQEYQPLLFARDPESRIDAIAMKLVDALDDREFDLEHKR